MTDSAALSNHIPGTRAQRKSSASFGDASDWDVRVASDSDYFGRWLSYVADICGGMNVGSRVLTSSRWSNLGSQEIGMSAALRPSVQLSNSEWATVWLHLCDTFPQCSSHDAVLAFVDGGLDSMRARSGICDVQTETTFVGLLAQLV